MTDAAEIVAKVRAGKLDPRPAAVALGLPFDQDIIMGILEAAASQVGDFGWALTQMRAGLRVARTGWEPSEHIRIKGDEIIDEDGKRTVFTTCAPMLATDWRLAT